MLTTNRSKGVIGCVLVMMAAMGIMLPAGAVYNTPILNLPASGTVITGDSVTLRWFYVDDTQYYQLQVAYDAACTQVIVNKWGIVDTINYFQHTGLPQDGTTFYWRVRATLSSYHEEPSWDSEWSEVWSFTSNSTEITPTEPHPADTNEDWRLIMNEAVPYISGWQQGTNLIGDAIRGASLWQNGEYYDFDPYQQCPLCWVLAAKNTSNVLLSGTGEAVRVAADGVVSLSVAPASGASVWGVEEQIPDGLNVLDITGANAAWNEESRKLTWWGTGNEPVTLGYTVSGASGAYALDGIANVDGISVSIQGDGEIVFKADEEQVIPDPDEPMSSDEGEQAPAEEGEAVDENTPDDGEVVLDASNDLAADEGEAQEADVKDEDCACGGCLAAGKAAIQERLSQWLLLALSCLILLSYSRIR